MNTNMLEVVLRYVGGSIIIFVGFTVFFISKYCIKKWKRRRLENAINLILRAPNLEEVLHITHPNVMNPENLILHDRNPVENTHRDELPPSYDECFDKNVKR